jgi:hypothetical protein
MGALRIAAGVLSAVIAFVLSPLVHPERPPGDTTNIQQPTAGGDQPPPASQVQPARVVLEQAAQRHGVDPDLVLALAWWESGWDQSRVSETGAVGLMQVQPEVADTAGPQLLGRRVDVHNPVDNADMGVALLRQLLADTNGDTQLALADYYQGQASVASDGVQSDTQQYVEGILALDARLKAGDGPP